MTRGRFITFEGIEGVGKSTQIANFIATLAAADIDVTETREPGGTPNAERIRDILKAHSDELMPDIAELLLMFAARAINTANTIRPALASGHWVVADRYTDSTRAYQGGARGLPRERIDTIAEWVHGDTNPDATVLLDAPAEVGLSRIDRRGKTDRIESEKLEFFSRARERYLELAEAEPDRFFVINANTDLANVTDAVTGVASRLIEKFNK